MASLNDKTNELRLTDNKVRNYRLTLLALLAPGLITWAATIAWLLLR